MDLYAEEMAGVSAAHDEWKRKCLAAEAKLCTTELEHDALVRHAAPALPGPQAWHPASQVPGRTKGRRGFGWPAPRPRLLQQPGASPCAASGLAGPTPPLAVLRREVNARLGEQVSEQLRLGQEVAQLTEAKEAAEGASARAHTELHHLQQRAARLAAQLQVLRAWLSLQLQELVLRCAPSLHCPAAGQHSELHLVAVQGQVDEAARLRSAFHASEALVDSLSRTQAEAAEAKRTGMPARLTCGFLVPAWPALSYLAAASWLPPMTGRAVPLVQARSALQTLCGTARA